MNAKRRKALDEIAADLTEIKDDLDTKLSDIRDRLEAVKEEEEEVVDNTKPHVQLSRVWIMHCHRSTTRLAKSNLQLNKPTTVHAILD